MGEWAEAVVEFSDTLVVFGDTECRAPVYRAALQLAEASSEPPSDDVDTAAPESGLSSLEGGRLVRIDCSGVRWRSPAAVLIVESSTSVRAMWEGSILRLERPS
jgi:hypothetical protein